MKGELNKPGKPALRKESLDHGVFSLEEGVRERTIDTFTSGVLANSQMEGEAIPFEITAGTEVQTINVGTGIAIAPHTDGYNEEIIASDPPFGAINLATGGDRIVIPRADVVDSVENIYSRQESSPGSGEGTGPFREWDDGLGGWAYTPESTKPLAVGPLANNATNRIWLSYVPTIDRTTYGIHPITGQRLYTTKGDGYEIRFTTSDLKPELQERYFKIGEVTLVEGAITNIDQSMMPMAKSRLNRVGIKVDSTKPPTAYADGVETFLDDHVNGLGTGVVSPTNVHGYDVADLTGFDDLGVAHNQSAHTDGLKNADDTCVAISSGTVVGLGQRVIRVKKLGAQEFAVIGGRMKDVILPEISVGGDAYVQFDETVTSDSYYIYLYVSSNDCLVDKKKVSEVGTLPANHIKLGIVAWVGGVSPTLTITSDLRSLAFGLVGNVNLQALAVSSYKIAPADAGIVQTLTTGNGIKTGHIVDQAVTTAKIADGAITGAKLQSSTIPYPIRWCVQGEAVTGTRVVQALANAEGRITSMGIYEDNISATGILTIDVLIDGVSIFATKPQIQAGSTANAGTGLYITSDSNSGLGVGPSQISPAYGARVGLIDATKNLVAAGSRVSLNLTQTSTLVGDGGGNDLLLSLILGPNT